MFRLNKLTLEVAKKIIEASEKEAKKLNVAMVITVLDDGGNLIASHRMDDAWLASIDISKNKAWTSVALKTETEELEEVTVPKTELYGLNTTNDGRIVVFGGGLPLKMNEKIIGAIGVSGSSVDNDTQVAKAGLKAFEEIIHA